MSALHKVHPSERRQFGRRTTCIHGWVAIEGRQKLPCLVRNVSEGGALLEFEVPKNMPFMFRLVIDSKGFDAHCEMRHHGPGWMGVQFVRFDKVAAPIRDWVSEVEAQDSWGGRR